MAPSVRIEERPGRICVGRGGFRWPTAEPGDEGIDAGMLAAAAEFARRHEADSLLITRNGRIVLEHYWNGKTAQDVQQTYSGTKSVFSLLVGRALERGYLRDLDQPVRELVPEMPGAQAQITFRNVLAMQSGMENSPRIEGLGRTGQTQLEIALAREVVAAPFERYHYNNAAYRLLFTALERAAGLDLEALTEREIFEPLSFAGAHWVRQYALDDAQPRFTGYQSIRMTPRDFAKSAQVIVDRGNWCGERFLPAEYVQSLVESPQPTINPSFGLFHHLNAGSFHCGYAVPDRIDRKLAPGVPGDMFLQFGAGGQIVAGIPSLQLVIVRTGRDGGSSIYDADNHIARLLRFVVCASAGDASEGDPSGGDLSGGDPSGGDLSGGDLSGGDGR
jgi:CubicO group peptidase (beta-lactamase class C family)